MGWNDVAAVVNPVNAVISKNGSNILQGKRSTSDPVDLPNLYTPEQGRAFGDQAAGMASSLIPPDVLRAVISGINTRPAANIMPINTGPNPFLDILKNIITGNTGMSDAERNLVANLQSTASGRYNALGIGDSGKATTEIAAAAAPALVDFQKNRADQAIRGGSLAESERAARTTEALNAEQLNTSRTAANDNYLVTALDSLIKSGAISMQSLLELAKLGAPQYGTVQRGQLPSMISGVNDLISAFGGAKALAK